MGLECVRQGGEVIHALLHPRGKDPQTVVEVNEGELGETDHLGIGEFLYPDLAEGVFEGVEAVVEREEEVC